MVRIHVLGICSPDITLRHAWETHLCPLRQGKLHFWSLGVSARWLDWIGGRGCHQSFPDAPALIAAFARQLADGPLYLSLDKDVLSPQVVASNWDQGQWLAEDVLQLIAACRGRLVGADICGEISDYAYRSQFKRWLSGLEGQPALPADLAHEQQRHRQLNQRLLAAIDSAWRR